MNAGGLYGPKDLIGWVLSSWRARAVLPLVRGTLVDLSCGDNRLVKHYGRGTGVDVTDYGPADLVLKDYRRLPFDSGSVDTVAIIASFNCFEYPFEELKEIRRILSGHGRLLVTLPHLKALKWWHTFRPAHKARRSVSVSQLKELLAQAGLAVVEEKPFMLFLNRIYVAEPVQDSGH